MRAAQVPASGTVADKQEAADSVGSSVLAVVGHRQIGRMSLLFCRGLIGGCDLRRLFLGVPEFCRCVCTYGFDV